MEMLCLMWEAVPRGSLLVAGKRPNFKLLASLSATQVKEAELLVDELGQNEVFSRDKDGTIYSRRMRRDVEKVAKDKANGSMGGNPRLKATGRNEDKAGVNPGHNREDKPGVGEGVKAHGNNPEARQDPTRERHLLGKDTGQAGQALPARLNGSAYGWDDGEGESADA